MISVLTSAVRTMLRDSDSRTRGKRSQHSDLHTQQNADDGVRWTYLFRVLYGAKPDMPRLRAFGAPCAMVEPL